MEVAWGKLLLAWRLIRSGVAARCSRDESKVIVKVSLSLGESCVRDFDATGTMSLWPGLGHSFQHDIFFESNALFERTVPGSSLPLF